jgi:hypothetical protein
VRPILTMSANAFAFSSSPRCRWRSAGSRSSLISRTVAMCMAVGKVSFEDWPRLTWSFGCTSDFSPRLPPSAWLARFAMTSLAFMFDCVPEPVCQITNGNSSSCRPCRTSAAAAEMASARRGSHRALRLCAPVAPLDTDAEILQSSRHGDPPESSEVCCRLQLRPAISSDTSGRRWGPGTRDSLRCR